MIPITNILSVNFLSAYVASASTGDTLDFSFNRDVVDVTPVLNSGKVFQVRADGTGFSLINVEDISSGSPSVSDYEGSIYVSFSDGAAADISLKVVNY